jgi:hypothetical protein
VRLRALLGPLLALSVALAGCGVKAAPRPAASAGVEGAPAGSGK